MSASQLIRVALSDPSAVGEARRRATTLAGHLTFDEEEAGEVALVVTELATNVIRHGKGGELLLQLIQRGGVEGIEVVGLDRGPGMDFARSSQDGFSTGGSSGFGLGAIRRKSARMDVHSDERGTVIAVELFPRSRGAIEDPKVDAAGLSVPHPSEQVCGDAWAVECFGARVMVCVVDGLGHGVGAANASKEAIAAFRAAAGRPVLEVMERLHAALRSTRGAAAAVADLRRDERRLSYCGVGNICATLVEPGTQASLVSMNGTLGHGTPRLQEFSYPAPAGAVLVMHSDGLTNHWSLSRYAGGLRRAAAVISGLLYRDFSRGRDDVTVVTVKEPQR